MRHLFFLLGFLLSGMICWIFAPVGFSGGGSWIIGRKQILNRDCELYEGVWISEKKYSFELQDYYDLSSTRTWETPRELKIVRIGKELYEIDWGPVQIIHIDNTGGLNGKHYVLMRVGNALYLQTRSPDDEYIDTGHFWILASESLLKK